MDRVKHNHFPDRIRVVPNFISSIPAVYSPRLAGRNTLLFVGTMGYYANRDGMSWFLNSIWKHILNEIPDAKLLIVGNWPDWVHPGSEYQQPGVQVRYFVEDLSQVFHEADIFICPLRLGTGTRLKIIEAWANTLPVVSTSVGIEGLAVISDVHAIIQDDAIKFAKSIVDLLRSPDQRIAIGLSGYSLAKSLYTLESVGSLASNYCQTLIDTTLAQNIY